MPSDIHNFLPYFNQDGDVYSDLFGTINSIPKSKIFDINDLNQGALTNALEWHFGVKKNAIDSLNIRNATGTFLDIWGDVFGIKRPQGMVDEIYKDYLLKSIFDFNPTVVGLDVLSKKYSFSYRVYDEMGVYLDKSFLDVGVTNLKEANYLFSSVIVDETLKRSFFLSANSMASFSSDFLQEIQVEKPSGVELYLAETSVFKFLSFPEKMMEAVQKAESSIQGYSISKVDYDVEELDGILDYDEVTFHPISLTTPYGVFETRVTSLNMGQYFQNYKDKEVNIFFIVMRRTNEKFSDKDSYICTLELYPISNYPIINFKYPTTLDAVNKDENIKFLFMVNFLKSNDGTLLYYVNPEIINHGKKVFEEVPVLVDVTWKYNFSELDKFLNPRVAFFDITAPILHDARPTNIQNQFFNNGSLIIQPMIIKMKEDGVHVSKETGLNLDIFQPNAYTNSKNILGTAIAGVILARRTKMLFKEQFQFELEVQPVVRYEDGSISSPLNGNVSVDTEKYKIATFNEDFIDFIYYPNIDNGNIIFIESFGNFPNYILEKRDGYLISKILLDAQAI